MHSSTTLAVILLAASAASPALAAPLNVKQAREFDELMAREPSLLSILKPLGTGVLGGAAVPLLNHFLGGDHSSSSSSRSITLPFNLGLEQTKVTPHELKALGFTRRELDELASREPSLLSILKPLGTGVLGGAAVPLINHFLGGGHSSSASSRAFSLPIGGLGLGLGPEQITPQQLKANNKKIKAFKHLKESSSKRDLASIEQDVKNFIGKFTHKAPTPISSKLGEAREYDELDARDLASIEQDVKDFIGKFTHKAATPVSSKALEAREYDELVARKSILGSLLGATEDSLGTVLKTGTAAGLASGAVGAVGGEVEHLFGNKDSSSKRELEERLNLGPIEKGLIGTVTSLGASGAASGLLGKLFGDKDSSSRRDITPEQALAAILLSGRSFNELD
ncbi:hypothetical protein FA95DRAFT_1610593 [Auriscalpium vulgare]|uniref:Uncharacterized protein n=1 Tax=Auriscalpium vulgare TaxID=40419 RepID=A0ACB8RCQ5_9AGAM|nr:hypothetical protein FA95DRAFT_1610593 [Auriscalpium vulgare]